MKVLLLTYHFPTPEEPGGSRPWAAAQILTELGHTVTVVTAGTNYMTGERTQAYRRLWTRETLGGVTLVKTFSTTNYRRSSFRRLVNYSLYYFLSFFAGLRSAKNDLVFTSVGGNPLDPIINPPVTYLLAKLKRSKVIVDYRDPYPEVAVALGYIRSGTLVKCIDYWQRFFLKRSAWLTAATPGIKRLLIDKGLPSDRISVIPNFSYGLLDANDIPGDNRHILKHLRPNFIAIIAGGLGQSKSTMTILEAAQIVQKEVGAKIQFVFIGDGEKKQDYIDWCKTNRISACHFVGILPKVSLLATLTRADIGIYSLRCEEIWRCVLSNTVLDYLDCGLPTIFAGDGDTREMIEEDKSGIVVKPEDPKAMAEAILSLFWNPEQRKSMGANGRNYIKSRFSRDNLQGQFREFLKKVSGSAP